MPIAPLTAFACWQLLKRSRHGMFLSAPKGVQLRAFVTESAHRVAGVASLILLADIGDQRLRALHFYFERGDQCIFGVNDDVPRFPLYFKADRKMHPCLPLSMSKNIAHLSCEVELRRAFSCEWARPASCFMNSSNSRFISAILLSGRSSTGRPQEVGIASSSNVRSV